MMADEKKQKRYEGSHPQIRTIEIAEHAGLSPEAARRVLEQAISDIPDGELRNFRTGQILIVH